MVVQSRVQCAQLLGKLGGVLEREHNAFARQSCPFRAIGFIQMLSNEGGEYNIKS